MIHERSDDPEQIQPEDVEEWFTNLPALAQQVETNRAESVKDRRNLRRILTAVTYLFAFMTVIGLTAGFLLQRQADDNARTLGVTRQAAYKQCQLVNDNARALNRFLDQVIASVKSSPTLTRDEKAYRVQTYESIKQQLPLCERP